ncbi:MAG TPA: adenylosuccinate synthase, partial [Bacteroidetes bacterium]|nr:adenylosuccinate synthase [Bacteroidota bacterium]
PVYKSFRGWKEKTSDVRRFRDLPPRAQAYVRAVERLLHTNVWMVSVGARRDQTLAVPRG